MSNQAQKFKIGLFVLVSLLLGVAIIIWLGASRYFEPSHIATAFFKESVQGLEAGSPVKFRGVAVGRVKTIQLAPDGRLIEVVLSLNKNFKVTSDVGIKMNLMGLTGLKYLDMDTYGAEQQREDIHLDFEPLFPVIPTYPSDIREIGNALDNLFQKVRDVDVRTISHHLLRITARLDKLLSDTKLESIGADLSATVSETKDTAKKLNQEVTRIQKAKTLSRALEKATELLEGGTETARSADRLIRRTDNNINRLTQKLDRSADNLLELTTQWKRKPFSTFFFGAEEEKRKKP
jgi:phospholipid/cholesterol/gamma-HCH transport system substrate-binding protein